MLGYHVTMSVNKDEIAQNTVDIIEQHQPPVTAVWIAHNTRCNANSDPVTAARQ